MYQTKAEKLAPFFRAVPLIVAALLTACVPQVRVQPAGCNGALESPTTLVTAAHCVTGLSERAPWAQGASALAGASGSSRKVRATPVEVDTGRDVARLTLDTPVWALWYATRQEPEVGDTGYVIGNCPLRGGNPFRVVATGVVTGHDGVARWEWHVRDGQVSCGGDSGSPVWSYAEPGVYYGVVSRYERLRMMARSTEGAHALLVFDAGATIYTGAGE